MRLTFLMLLTITACQRYPEFRYPDFAKSDVVDDFHGTPVADPWRGLEDPNSDATKAWVDAQNAITFPYLKSLKDRDAIETRLTELWDYEKFGTPFTRGSSTFYFRNDGLQNQSVLYKRIGDGEPDVLIDPNTFSEDGTISLTMASPPKTAATWPMASHPVARIGTNTRCGMWPRAWIFPITSNG